MSKMVAPIADPPPGIELSPVPNIRMAAGAASWITDVLGIPVTERYVRVKTNERMIRYSLIGGVRHYSTRALWDYVMSTERSAS